MHKNHLKKNHSALRGFFFSDTAWNTRSEKKCLSPNCAFLGWFSFFLFWLFNLEWQDSFLHKAAQTLQTKNHLLSITPGAQLWLPPPPLLQEGPLLLSWASQLTLQVFVASHFHLHSLHFENFPSKQISFWQELWTSVSRGLASSRVEEPEQNDQEVFRSAVWAQPF